MSFLIELSTVFQQRFGMTIPKDFIVYDSEDDIINFQVEEFVKYLDRVGMKLVSSEVSPEGDAIEFQATSEKTAEQFSNTAWNTLEQEFEENDFVEFFDFNTDTNKFKIDFNKKVRKY